MAALLIEDIMTTAIHTVARSCSLRDVARTMRDRRIGDVLIVDDAGALCGIVTDRDLVVRAVAEGMSDAAPVGDICTAAPVRLHESATLDEAVKLMRAHAIRRVPVVRGDRPVGIVSIGDLARHEDPRSALAEISWAAANG